MQLNRPLLGALALLATGVAGFAAGRATPQEFFVEPTEQHRWLAGQAGDYEGKLTGMMGESEAASHVESILGGLWTVTDFETTLMGAPLKGLEIRGYDTHQEKFVSVWIDSMSTSLIVSEGDYDEEAKMLTLKGLSKGMDGEEAMMINRWHYSDAGMKYTMGFEGEAGPAMTIDYTRK